MSCATILNTTLVSDDRSAGGRVPPPQVFSPPGPSRQQAQHAQQHSASYRSPAAPVTLPAPRLGPLPGGPVPGLGGGEYTPRGRRDQPGSHADRPRYMPMAFFGRDLNVLCTIYAVLQWCELYCSVACRLCLPLSRHIVA